METPRTRAFGDFELDLDTGELRRNGVPVPLQRQPARVLAVLVARAGTLVSREDLKDAVWTAHTFVDFNRGLNYCIRHLRAALGDDAKAPRFIETVARQGYRFVAPVNAGHGIGRSRARGFHVTPRRLAAAALVTLILLTGWVERGANPDHHDKALAAARIVHDFLF